MYKQIIIARKDLGMSPGKLAAQVSHGSMAFLTTKIRESSTLLTSDMQEAFGLYGETSPFYACNFSIDADLYDQWINGAFTKCVLRAKNRNNLLKAKEMAENLGMTEGKDFFLIRDNCYTELEPEDEDGRTLTCIGFRPMDSEVIDQIGKKYHLYVE